MLDWTGDLPFSRSYLTIVIAVAVAVGGLAIFGRSSTLALAAAILGLYVLHLYSNYQLASSQRQQWQTLREVERMLDALDESAPGRPVPRPGHSPAPGYGAAEAETAQGTPATAPGGSEASSGPPRAGTESGASRAPVPSDSARSPEPDGSSEPPLSAGTNGSDGDSVPVEGSDAAREEPRGVGTSREGRGGDEREGGGTEGHEEDDDTVLVPRQYRLGTVAVVQRVLTPGEVARILAVQNRDPDRQFGDIAVELDLLSEAELEELLRIQDRGLYRPEAISRARRELKHYQRQKAAELGTGP